MPSPKSPLADEQWVSFSSSMVTIVLSRRDPCGQEVSVGPAGTTPITSSSAPTASLGKGAPQPQTSRLASDRARLRALAFTVNLACAARLQS